MNRLIPLLMALSIIPSQAGCASDEPAAAQEETVQTENATASSEQAEDAENIENTENTEATETTENPQDASDLSEDPEADQNTITVTAGDTSFTAVLYDNETAQAFYDMLPLTLDMSELNGNEKYFYIDEPLKVDAHSPGTINSGDIKLYGCDCIVLFYETFSSGYSYTDIGKIDDPEGLTQALGGGSVSVTFTKG